MHGILITDGEVQKQVVEILPHDHTGGETQFAGSFFKFQLVGQRDKVSFGSFFQGRRQVLAGDVVAQQIEPILRCCYRIQHAGVVPNGIEPAHNGAHAGAGNVVDGNAGFFEYFEGTNVDKAFGASSLEHHAHFFARLILCHGDRKNQKIKYGYDKRLFSHGFVLFFTNCGYV